MKNWKSIIFFVLPFLTDTVCLAQRETIDSLKKVLPSLRDSARVDCLNALGALYLPENWEDTLQNDTCKLYVELAFYEAKKINYAHGMAEALAWKTEIAIDVMNVSEVETSARHAIDLFKRTPNKKGLTLNYYNLGRALFAQSKFGEALQALEDCKTLSKQTGDNYFLFWSILVTGLVYRESGNFEKAFEKVLEGQQLALKYDNDEWKETELTIIGDLYRDIEDYSTALSYYRKSFEGAIPPYKNHNVEDLAEVFSLNNQFDSASYYYSFGDTSTPRSLRFHIVSMGRYYFLLKQYDLALSYLLRGLNYHERVNDRNQVMGALLAIAKTYDSLHDYTDAFKYATEGLIWAQQTRARQLIRDGYQILSSIYDYWREKDSAYFYYRQYTAVKDAILTDQFKGKLVAFNYTQKIALLNKEKEIRQAELRTESREKKFLIGGICVLLVLVAVVFRNIILSRKNETHRRELAENELQIQKLESQKQLSKLEMQALRAQMNPHFIFNSLNSINRFILQNNKSEASEYLTKFSRLVRLILQNSQAALIPLESELEALKLYLELEAVRFDHRFDYKIIVDEDVDTDISRVPPLIIQPYAENAIWHGLMHKEEKGHLQIELFECDEALFYKIKDDGVGRKKAAELKSKSASSHKSMGMRITADRIAMLQQQKQIDTTIKITDLVLPDGNPGGTEVLLKIPLML